MLTAKIQHWRVVTIVNFKSNLFWKFPQILSCPLKLKIFNLQGLNIGCNSLLILKNIISQGESKQRKVIAAKKGESNNARREWAMQSRSEQHNTGDSNARPKSLWVLYITGLSGRGAALNPKPKFPSSLPNPKPWPQTLRIRSKFSYENPFGSFFFPPVLVLLLGSHMGENLKTGFQPSFHPKWEQLVLNVRTRLRTQSPSENRLTLAETQYYFRDNFIVSGTSCLSSEDYLLPTLAGSTLIMFAFRNIEIFNQKNWKKCEGK